MSKAPPVRRPAPLSLRLTPEERLRLERDAAGLSLAAYIKSRLFEGQRPTRSRGKFPVHDHRTLSSALGILGQSGIANSLNQLARTAAAGALDLTPEIEAELRQACADIAAVRRFLIESLGLTADPRPESDL